MATRLMSSIPDGHSLPGLLSGDENGGPDEVIVEFMVEGVLSPCTILRKDGFKYVYCEADPPMMFNLKVDPFELSNLRGNPNTAELEAEMLAEIQARRDPAAIKQDVLLSQRRRRYLQRVLLKGDRSPRGDRPTS